MDRERCTAVPEDIEFATKPRLAQRMIERALTAGVPVSWVLGDEGNDRRLRLWLEQHARVLAVKAPLWALVRGRSRCRPRIGRTSGGLAPPERRGEGRASVRLGAVPAVPPAAGAHWLLVRRKLSKPDEMAYYVVFGPAATSLEAGSPVGAGRSRSASRRPSRRSGGYEVRSWHGWYRHITLSMLALAFLAAMRVELASQKGAEDPAHSLPSACPRSVASSPASR
jgi:hypothetical protein